MDGRMNEWMDGWMDGRALIPHHATHSAIWAPSPIGERGSGRLCNARVQKAKVELELRAKARARPGIRGEVG